MSFKSLKVFDYDYAYLDSEAPPTSSNYTTWVICHGLGFNAVYIRGAAVFEKILPVAHAHNLRIVSLNRRGYPPSSGFQEEELKGIGHGKTFEEAEPFFRVQGTELATFLVNFATEQSIPSADPNNHTGAIHVLALLAYLDELPQDSRATLQKYLHTTLTHDGSTTGLGIPKPDEHDISLWFEIDDRKRFDAFFDWATAHYIHKSTTSGNLTDLEFNNPSDVPHSLHELSYEQRAKYTHMEAFVYTGCDGRLLFCDTTAFAALAKRALFDRARAEAFPNVRVRYMASGTSAGVLIPSLAIATVLEELGSGVVWK